MPQGLKRVYDALWQEVASAHASWKLFTQLFSHSQERVALLNTMLPDFSSIVFHALRNSVVMSLCKLTDLVETGAHENLCLRRLTLHLRASRFKLLVREITGRISEAEEFCSPFREWRNRELAHTDWRAKARYTREPLPSITKEQFDEALRRVAALLNTVLRHFEDSSTDFDHVLLRGDGDALAHWLEKFESYRQAELEELRKLAQPGKSGTP